MNTPTNTTNNNNNNNNEAINDNNTTTDIQKLQALVTQLQNQNYSLTQKWQQERLGWESRIMDYQNESDRLQRRVDELEDQLIHYTKIKDELEAAHMELEHLSKLYAEFMSWKHDKLVLEGERDKLLLQNKRQQQTIGYLEKKYVATTANNNGDGISKEFVKQELKRLEQEQQQNQEGNHEQQRRRRRRQQQQKNSHQTFEQASFVKGVVKQQQNRFWMTWAFLSSQGITGDSAEEDTTDLNALKRLDDHMVRAKQMSRSSSEFPIPTNDNDDDDDDAISLRHYPDDVRPVDPEDDQLFLSQGEHRNSIDNNGGNGAIRDHGLDDDKISCGGGGGFGLFQRGRDSMPQRDGRFEHSTRDLYSQPRVSEGPQNLQNVLNLI